MVTDITINNLGVHACLPLNQLGSINVVLGENDTGKTSLIKLIYAVCRSIEESGLKQQEPLKKILADKILGTFQPKGELGNLVRKGQPEKLSCELTFENGSTKQNLYFSFGAKTTNTINDCTSHLDQVDNSFNALFIPAKEVLTAFDAIAATRENLYMDGFDDTYLDLIRALRIKTSQGKVSRELSGVNKTLEDLFEGSVTQSNKEDSFIFKKKNTEFVMGMTAEGIKKIGILTTLIRNRRLGRNTVLFMDEPETALHPKAIRKLAEMLAAMSRCGVQIFLTSHSYFLIKQLGIIARRDQQDFTCISLEQQENKQITAQIASLKNGLPDNPIIQAAIDMFTEEMAVEVNR